MADIGTSEPLGALDSWTGLELRHLDAFRAVAHERSFGKAATRLGYSQSAVSHQIAAIERIIGDRVLIRPGGPGPVSLTEVGELLLSHSETIAATLRAARGDVAAVLEGRAGTVRVGTYQSVGARILPGAIRHLKAQAPDIVVSLREALNFRELLSLVEDGDVDVTFVVLPLAAQGPFQVRHLLVDPYVALVPHESPLAARQGVGVALDELIDYPLIDYAHAFDAVRIDALLARSGQAANVQYRSDHDATVQGLVAAGLGIAVVPSLTIDPNCRDVCMIKITSGIPARAIGLAWHRGRYHSPACARFIEAAGVACQNVVSADRRVA